jgi:pimeloyl-ACP methyl ester carboxylesterase
MTALAGERDWVGDLSLLRWGESDEGRDALLLIHPANLQARSWQRVVTPLSDRRLCIAPDLRGYGESTREGPFSVAGWARDCQWIVDSLHLERIHVVGASVGATVALELAAARPERIGSVVALGGAFLPLSPAEDEVMARLRQSGLDPSLRRWLVDGAVGPDTSQGVLQTIADEVSDNEPDCAAALWRAALASDVRPLIGKLRGRSARYLLVTGELDGSCPPAEARSLAHQLGCAYRELAGVGHLSMYECPEEIAILIDEWITREGSR